MATLNLPNIIENETNADAVELEQNNSYLETFVNTQLIHRDGAVAMTAQLTLVGDPVAEGDAARKAYVDAILPVGIILPYGGVTAPAGRWALANGALLNTAEFPELFTVFQYRFGGAGAQFALPDLRSRTIFGYNVADTDFNTVGKTGGTKNVPLLQHSHDMTHAHSASSGTVSNDHAHTFSGTTGGQNATHVHGIQGTSEQTTPGGFGEGNWADWGGPVGAYMGETSEAIGDHAHGYSGTTSGITANHTHSITVNTFSANTGNAGTAGVTMIPPYITLPYIVRTD